MDDDIVIVNRQEIIDEVKWCLHQTPRPLALRIINDIDFSINARVMDPFSGSGSFYDQFPEYVNKFKTEIRDGTCYSQFDYVGNNIQYIVTNPPYALKNDDNTEKNAYHKLLMFFAVIRTIKKVVFLSSATCYNSLTRKRTKELNDAGMYLEKVTMCECSKWRNRYYVLHFGRQPVENLGYYPEGY